MQLRQLRGVLEGQGAVGLTVARVALWGLRWRLRDATAPPAAAGRAAARG
eukprot:COSAG01_NODE_38901_length_483_cov_14.018229_1_plen_49_part_10